MVGIQGKFNNCQQNQYDAVDVDNDSCLLGIVQSFDLDSANVKSHEHGDQLKETLVSIRDGQPYDSSRTNTSVYKIVNVFLFRLYKVIIVSKQYELFDEEEYPHINLYLTVIEVGC